MDSPRAASLLKMATTLQRPFDERVQSQDEGKPVVAFRKKGGAIFREENRVKFGFSQSPIGNDLPRRHFTLDPPRRSAPGGRLRAEYVCRDIRRRPLSRG